jgi:hypothetical protein
MPTKILDEFMDKVTQVGAAAGVGAVGTVLQNPGIPEAAILASIPAVIGMDGT